MQINKCPLKYFEDKYKSERNSKIKTRLQILMHIREGYTQREISKMLRISVGIVPYWKFRFETGGIDGLQDKDGRGLKSNISEEELSMFASELDYGIKMEDGYRRGMKTKDATEFFSEQFGKEYTTRHCRRIIKSIDCTLQVPRTRNKKRNQKDVEKIKRDYKKNEKYWVMT